MFTRIEQDAIRQLARSIAYQVLNEADPGFDYGPITGFGAWFGTFADPNPYFSWDFGTLTDPNNLNFDFEEFS